jgi:hypothetical protein
MADRTDATGGKTQPSRPDEAPTTGYEPPSIEDLDTTEGPSVTAAGGTVTIAAPRKL